MTAVQSNELGQWDNTIRVHIKTKPERFNELKKAHLEAGFQIANENPVPVNGLVSFDAMRQRAEASA